MNMRWIASLAAALVACGGDDGGDGDDDGGPTGDTFESGTRLKAVYQDGGGGAVRLVRWFDSQLDAPCRFAYAPDGVLRCLPTTEFGVQFADAACTQPLALLGVADAVPDRIVVTELGCPGPIRRGTPYAIGGVHTVASTYIMGQDGICQSSGPVTNDVVARDITVLDEAMFAAAEMATVMRDGEGDTQAIRGADGAYEVVNPIDATGGPCARGNIDDRCQPWAMSYSLEELFGDATCTQPVAYSVGSVDCPAPAFAIVHTRVDGCYMHSVASVGAAIPMEDIYESGTGGSCAPATYPRGSRYWALGAAAADPFMHISAAEIGTGRLRVPYVANAQGVLLAPDGEITWHDTQLDIDCSVSDGRCLPWQSVRIAGADAYADAACTQHLYEDSTGCAGVPEVPTWVGASEMDGAIVGVFPVGAPFTGQVYTLNNGTTCEPRTVDPSSRFFSVGAMSGLDVLAAVPEVTAP
jgi:hypothetical protein